MDIKDIQHFTKVNNAKLQFSQLFEKDFPEPKVLQEKVLLLTEAFAEEYGFPDDDAKHCALVWASFLFANKEDMSIDEIHKTVNDMVEYMEGAPLN